MSLSVPRAPKKGFVYDSTGQDFETKLNIIKPAWYYNRTVTPSSNVDDSVRFIPMLRDASHILPTDPHTEIFFTFYEPDNSLEANLTVQEAVSLWPSVDLDYGRSGSPVTLQNPSTPNSWLSQFMSSNVDVHFMCVEWYGPPDINAFITDMENIFMDYRKPICVIEMAVADTTGGHPGGYDVSLVEQFMKTLDSTLQTREYSYIARYCWYTKPNSDNIMGTSKLFDDFGNLTHLGQVYSQL